MSLPYAIFETSNITATATLPSLTVAMVPHCNGGVQQGEKRHLHPSNPSSPGAQKHLIHISSTKGFTPGMGRTVLRNPQKAFLKFRLLCKFWEERNKVFPP